MIYATDNGQDYDEHDQYFYELPDDLPVEEGVWLVENKPCGYGSEEVMFVAKLVNNPHNFKLRHGFADAAYDIIDESRDGEWMKRCPKALLLSAVDAGMKEIVARQEDLVRRHTTDAEIYGNDKRNLPGWVTATLEGYKDKVVRFAELRVWVEARP